MLLPPTPLSYNLVKCLPDTSFSPNLGRFEPSPGFFSQLILNHSFIEAASTAPSWMVPERMIKAYQCYICPYIFKIGTKSGLISVFEGVFLHRTRLHQFINSYSTPGCEHHQTDTSLIRTSGFSVHMDAGSPLLQPWYYLRRRIRAVGKLSIISASETFTWTGVRRIGEWFPHWKGQCEWG